MTNAPFSSGQFPTLRAVRRESEPGLFSVPQAEHPSLLTHFLSSAAQGLARRGWALRRCSAGSGEQDGGDAAFLGLFSPSAPCIEPQPGDFSADTRPGALGDLMNVCRGRRVCVNISSHPTGHGCPGTATAATSRALWGFSATPAPPKAEEEQ